MFVMLNSISDIQEELKQVLEDQQQLLRMANLDFSVILDLITFLNPFYDATKALEGDLRPTIHHVFLWFSKLQKAMSLRPVDSPLIGFLKKRGSEALSKKFEIQNLHKLALFMNPKFKALLAFPEKDRLEVQMYAEELLLSITGLEEVESSTEHEISGSDHTYDTENNKKKICIDDDFPHWQNNTVRGNDSDNEVRVYAKAAFDEDMVERFCCDSGFDILKFWLSADMKHRFPRLSRLALGILSVPASSASSERAFSAAGNTVTKKRTQLASSSVNALLVVHSKLNEANRKLSLKQ